jgi:hypothetical protein
MNLKNSKSLSILLSLKSVWQSFFLKAIHYVLFMVKCVKKKV